jgi:predicted TIM-barrel fold metal-dependent hydrolase
MSDLHKERRRLFTMHPSYGKIIDAHSHIFPEKIAEKATKAISDFYEIPMEHIGMTDELLQSGAKIGVDKYLVCSSATTPKQVASINTFIAQACKQHSCFFGFGTLHPDMEEIEKETERIVSLGLHGQKLHPDFQRFNIDDEHAIPMYRIIAKAGLPILFHSGDNRYDYSAPKRIRNVLEQVPDLICIAAHFGGYQRWQEAHDCLKDERIYFDTSSSLFALSKEDALGLIDYFGEDHFFFGSDFPMWDHEEELERFLALGLTEEQNQKIFYQNFERVFRLD